MTAPRPRRKPRAARAPLLLLGLAALAAPAHAQNETEVWSATMTTAQFAHDGGSHTGFLADPASGSLTDTQFTHGDETYNVKWLSRDNGDGALYLEVKDEPESCCPPDLTVVGAHWTLHVGSRGYAFAEAGEHGIPGTGQYTWPNAPNLSAGQEVAVKIVTTEPGPPKDFAAAGGEGAATLTWSAPDGPGGYPITGYRYRTRAPGAAEWGGWFDIPDSAGSREYEAMALVAGGEYGFQLAAVNAAGPGTLYATAEATVAGLPPPPLRSDRPCAGAIWCATLEVGGADLGGTTVTGFSASGTLFGTSSSTKIHGLARTYTVAYLHHETNPDGDRHTLFFDTFPAIPDGEKKEWTLDVGGLRFQFRDAARTAVPVLGVHNRPFAWRSGSAAVVNWAYGDTVSVRLFAPRGIPRGARLIPEGLGVGDRFRLLFVTNSLAWDPFDGTSFDIEDYNDVVRRQLRHGSHPGNPVAPYARAFTALVSTPFAAARDNAGTTHRASAGSEGQPAYAGVPVYWLNGDPDDEDFLKRKVADDYADLHDGDWDDEEHPKDAWGDDPCIHPPCTQMLVSTGSLADGSADPNAPFGAALIRAGALNHDEAQGPVATGRRELVYDYCNANAAQRQACDTYGDDYGEDDNVYEDTPVVTVPQWERQFLYGLSPVFEIEATKPVVHDFAATTNRDLEIELTWDLDDGGSPLTGLGIQRRRGGAWVDVVAFDDFATRSHLFDDGVCGAETFRLVAENAEGMTRRRATGSSKGGDSDKAEPVDIEASDGRVGEIEVTWRLRGCEKTIDRIEVLHTRDDGMPGNLVAGTADRAARSFVHTGQPCGVARDYVLDIDYADGTATSTMAVAATTAPCALTGMFDSTVDIRGGDSGVSNHVGSSRQFVATVRFNQELRDDDDFRVAGLCPSLTVTNGTCIVSAVGTTDDVWTIRIKPDGDADVTLVLSAPTDCTANSAVCTAADNPLSADVATTVAGPPSMQSVALTAEFVADSVPAHHGGADTTFKVRIEFNQDPDVTGLCDALTVAGGTCQRSARVGDNASLWEVEIAPEASKPVTVALPETTDCDATGAVCTSDDSPLSAAVSTTVKPPVLASAWESLPNEHAGAGTTFTARVRFSEAVDVTDLCASFAVTDGTCTSSSRDADDDAVWEITVAPDGAADVRLALGFSTDCDATGAVCTEHGTPLSYGLLHVVPRRALTVAVESVPDDHGGIDTTFTVRVRFSEAVDVDGLCDAFYPHAATCDSSAKVGGDAALWDVMFAPEGAAAAELALPGTADCADADAVCTADDEPLTGGFLEIVPRRPFTAAWVDGSYPANHDGAGTTFTVRVRFSEDAIVSYLVLRDEALEVDGGDCNVFRRVNGRKDLWEATIKPAGLGAVSLTLDSPADCDAADAVCTQDDSPLVTVLELTVPGPGS